MSTRIQLPVANFSRDLRNTSRAAAAGAGMLAAGALIASAVLVFEGESYWTAKERMLGEISNLVFETEALRKQQSLQDPGPAAIAALRGRIASLNALDFAQAPSVTSVLAVLEELMPGAVALQNLDQDRIHGALEIVAVSEFERGADRVFRFRQQKPGLQVRAPR